MSGSSEFCQGLSLPVLHQDAATFTLVVDSGFFEANPGLQTKPADWDEKTNIVVW